jgi:hypothetical protein
MNNETFKRSAGPPESTATDVLPAEGSAGLMTGRDPLDYDWTRAAERQSSEDDNVPPMQVQATDTDTWDLEEAIRIETARFARYASRNATVGREGREPVFDVEWEGPPTQKRPTAPTNKEDDGSMPDASSEPDASSDGWHRDSKLVSLLLAGAALFLCATYFLARPGVTSTPSAGGMSTAAPPVVPNSLDDAASTFSPGKASPEAPQQRGIPTRVLERAVTEPSRAASPPKAVSSKSGPVDPLFAVNPGY